MPAAVGVPEITPELSGGFKPLGRPVALKLIGLLLAVILYENGTPTIPVAVNGGWMAGSNPTVNVTVFDVPPPGGGFTTVTDAVPAVATFAAGTIAVSCVEDTNVVDSSEPFQVT